MKFAYKNECCNPGTALLIFQAFVSPNLGSPGNFPFDTAQEGKEIPSDLADVVSVSPQGFERKKGSGTESLCQFFYLLPEWWQGQIMATLWDQHHLEDQLCFLLASKLEQITHPLRTFAYTSVKIGFAAPNSQSCFWIR